MGNFPKSKNFSIIQILPTSYVNIKRYSSMVIITLFYSVWIGNFLNGIDFFYVLNSQDAQHGNMSEEYPENIRRNSILAMVIQYR